MILRDGDPGEPDVPVLAAALVLRASGRDRRAGRRADAGRPRRRLRPASCRRSRGRSRPTARSAASSTTRSARRRRRSTCPSRAPRASRPRRSACSCPTTPATRSPDARARAAPAVAANQRRTSTMARAQGARAQMALGFESSYGTPPAAGDFWRMPFAQLQPRRRAAAARPPSCSAIGRDPLAPVKDAITATATSSSRSTPAISASG